MGWCGPRAAATALPARGHRALLTPIFVEACQGLGLADLYLHKSKFSHFPRAGTIIVPQQLIGAYPGRAPVAGAALGGGGRRGPRLNLEAANELALAHSLSLRKPLLAGTA